MFRMSFRGGRATFARAPSAFSALASASCPRRFDARAAVNALWAAAAMGEVTRGETRPLWRVALAALDAGALTRDGRTQLRDAAIQEAAERDAADDGRSDDDDEPDVAAIEASASLALERLAESGDEDDDGELDDAYRSIGRVSATQRHVADAAANLGLVAATEAKVTLVGPSSSVAWTARVDVLVEIPQDGTPTNARRRSSWRWTDRRIFYGAEGARAKAQRARARRRAGGTTLRDWLATRGCAGAKMGRVVLTYDVLTTRVVETDARGSRRRSGRRWRRRRRPPTSRCTRRPDRDGNTSILFDDVGYL